MIEMERSGIEIARLIAVKMQEAKPVIEKKRSGIEIARLIAVKEEYFHEIR